MGQHCLGDSRRPGRYRRCRDGATCKLLATILSLILIVTSSMQPCSSLPDCTSCRLTWDEVVCAEHNQALLELPGECVARCQGITQWSHGPCTNRTVHNGSDAITKSASSSAFSNIPSEKASGPNHHQSLVFFAPPAEALRALDVDITLADMTAQATLGYAYVGTYRSMDGPPEGLQTGSRRPRSHTQSTSENAVPLHAVEIKLPEGHMYVQTRTLDQQGPLPPLSHGPPRGPKTSQTSAPRVRRLLIGHKPSHQKRSGNNLNSRDLASGARRLLSGILGYDNRLDVTRLAGQYPYSTAIEIRYYKQGKYYICSGSLISPRVILTAGHCVFDTATKAYSTKFKLFTPDHKQGLRARVIRLTTFRQYMQYNDYVLDLGLLTLDRNLGYERGWLGISWDCSRSRQALRTIGYPGDKPFVSLWRTDCHSSSDSNPCMDLDLEHTCDTQPGQSGSPMYSATPQDSTPACNTTYNVPHAPYVPYNATNSGRYNSSHNASYTGAKNGEDGAYLRAVLTCKYEDEDYPYNCGVWMRPAVWPLIRYVITVAETLPVVS